MVLGAMFVCVSCTAGGGLDEAAAPDSAGAAPLYSHRDNQVEVGAAGRLVSISDGVDDIRRANGDTPAVPKLASDLTGVRVQAGGGVLSIVFTTRAEIPENSGPGRVLRGRDELLWILDVWRVGPGRRGLYQVRTSLIGTRWSVRLVDEVVGEQEALDIRPVIEGSVLRIELPLKNMPQLSEPFEWSARTEYGFFPVDSGDIPTYDAWGDLVPDAPWLEYGAPGYRVRYPGTVLSGQRSAG